MATPGYPQMGQMPPGMGGPPMGGPPMGGPPMGAPPMRPMRRGVSKAVPVVVSAGLAVGVFCGLLFGVGTGKKEAVAAPSKGTNHKEAKDDTPTAPTGETQNKITPTDKIQPKGMGSNVVVMNGSGGGSAAGSAATAMAGTAAGSAAAVAPKTTKVVIKVKPDAAAAVAKIQIDGKDIEGSSIDVPADKKSVKIAVTASGYHSFEPKSYDVSGDDMTVEIELTKRGGGASPGFGGADSHKPTVPTRPPGGDTGTKPTKPKKPPGGLIDI